MLRLSKGERRTLDYLFDKRFSCRAFLDLNTLQTIFAPFSRTGGFHDNKMQDMHMQTKQRRLKAVTNQKENAFQCH